MPPPLRPRVSQPSCFRSPRTNVHRRNVATTAPPSRRKLNPLHPKSIYLRLKEIYGPAPKLPTNVYDSRAIARHEALFQAYWWRRQKIGMVGATFGLTGLGIVIYILRTRHPLDQQFQYRNQQNCEAPPDKPNFGDVGTISAQQNLVRTGTDSVPFFPRTIKLASSSASSNRASTAPSAALPAGTALLGGGPSQNAAGEELSLLGLGIRTVSFLSIQVYVVGLYVATSDLAALHASMVKAGASVEGASTLVGQEVGDLKQKLLSPEEGLEIWNKVLKEEGIRSVVRVVPTRNTDYSHLRDGWVTGMTARSGNFGTGVGGETFDDERFGDAVAQFKSLLGGKKQLAKGRILLLEREANGRLLGWEETGNPKLVRTDPTNVDGAKFKNIGAVDDERVARLIWLGYLGGKKVSSEGARTSIVDGIMELVTRPVGTVETQVV